jgi:arylformamidase
MTRPADPSWLDAQYNNRARIPEHPQIFERWARDSLAARNALDARLDVPYGDGPNETLDLFVPARAAVAPVLVFIHGGWWRSLDKSDQSFVAPPFVDAGALVVVPNYALCPAVTIEQIALQMVRALAWTYRNASRFGGDASRIAVAGHSAGGHLAAMLLACRWSQVASDLPPTLLARALAISGVFDLEPVRRTPFLKADLRLSPAAVRKLSPAGWPAPAHGHLAAVVGADESEEFRRQNRLIRARWGERVVPVCEEVAGAHHLGVLDALAEPASRLHRIALDHLGLAASTA